jgi:hypothetical protein
MSTSEHDRQELQSGATLMFITCYWGDTSQGINSHTEISNPKTRSETIQVAKYFQA